MTTRHVPDDAPRSAASDRTTAPDDGSRNVALLIAYDGSAFQGWQLQDDAPTVQGALEDALRVLFRRRCVVHGSGRTDSGVHAYNQVANVRIPQGFDLRKLQQSLNALAAPHIAVKVAVDVPDHFHARHRARHKHYRYQIFNRPYPPVFGRHRAWWLRLPLDVVGMNRAAAHLVGTHDFSAFRASDCAAKSPTRTLKRLELRVVDWPECSLAVELEADGFLQHMARIIVGTLVAVGHGKLAPGDLPAILASGDRDRAFATAPAAGLHMVRVGYDLTDYPELEAFGPG